MRNIPRAGRYLPVLAIASALIATGAVATVDATPADNTDRIEGDATVLIQLAQNGTPATPQRPPNAGNPGNTTPGTAGGTDTRRPRGPERLCDDVRNPRPGQNCTENPDHFRPANRPPD